MGSIEAPTTIIRPFVPSPSTSDEIDLELGAVVRITRAPPSFCNSAAALVATVDVHARSQLFRERGIRRPAPDRGYLVAELLRELDRKVAEPSDTLDGDEVTGQRAAVAERIE